jgi:hypothetical protein
MFEMQKRAVHGALLELRSRNVDISCHPSRRNGAEFTTHGDFALVLRRNGIERLLLLSIDSTFETKYCIEGVAQNLQQKVQEEILAYWDAPDSETQRSRTIC